MTSRETSREWRKRMDSARERLAEEAGEWRRKENFEEAAKLFEKAAAISQKLGDTYLEQLYLASARAARVAEMNYKNAMQQTREEFDRLIQRGEDLVVAKDLDGASKVLREATDFPGTMQDNERLSKLVNLIEVCKQERIRSTILDLGTKFTRLQVVEIAEKCGLQDEDLIKSAIQDMILHGQIAAEYFKSTQAVAFNQQANIQEKDKFVAELEKEFAAWGKEVSKK